jgi:hypothetical protein
VAEFAEQNRTLDRLVEPNPGMSGKSFLRLSVFSAEPELICSWDRRKEWVATSPDLGG